TPPKSTIRACSGFKWHISHFRQSARCPTHEPDDALFFCGASSTYWRDAVFNNLWSKLYSYATFIQAISNTKKTCPSGKKRSEEHTSELQSRENLVCRLLL